MEPQTRVAGTPLQLNDIPAEMERVRKTCVDEAVNNGRILICAEAIAAIAKELIDIDKRLDEANHMMHPLRKHND